MNDKKQIEEMTKVIEPTYTHATKWFPDKYEPFELNVYPDEIARTLYNAGCRKLPENAVVLSREEYNEIKQYQNYIPEMKKAFDKIRKETAREIYKELYMFASQDYICGLRNEYKNNDYTYLVEKLAKQYGVDLGE